ncbi:MAG: F0F1 ATP synthase subunit B [Kiloniellales bacterium]|nr:F0F1 ATP synthase subunit B [Kiloniellales bacterium]
MFEDPTFWVAIGFAIFIGALFRPGLRFVTKGLDERAARIKAQLDEADALRVEAQNLLAEYKRKQRDAIEEADRMLAHAKEEVARAQEQGAKDLEQALARRRQQAEEKIQQAEAAALKEVREQAVDIAISATAKLLQDKLDDKQAAGLIDDSIKEVAAKLN